MSRSNDDMGLFYRSEESVGDSKVTPSNIDIPKPADAVPPSLMTMPAEVRRNILEALVQEHKVEIRMVLGVLNEIRGFYIFVKDASGAATAFRDSFLGVLSTSRQLRSEIASCISKIYVSLVLSHSEDSYQSVDSYRGTTGTYLKADRGITFLEAIQKHPLWAPLVKHVIFDTDSLVRQDAYPWVSVAAAFPSLRKVTIPGEDFYPPRGLLPNTALIDRDSHRMHLVHISRDYGMQELETFRRDSGAIGAVSKEGNMGTRPSFRWAQ